MHTYTEEYVCMNSIVTALVWHLIIIVLTIIYMNSQFYSTFIALAMKTVHILLLVYIVHVFNNSIVLLDFMGLKTIWDWTFLNKIFQ